MEQSKKQNLIKDWAFRALVFVGSILLIVYFMPRNAKFNYQFDVNEPWRYGDLMAEFDFPIYKDDALIQHEQDSIKDAFQPYYVVDQATTNEALAKLRSDYDSRLKDVLPSAAYYTHIEKTLKEIYQKGVIDQSDIESLENDNTESVMLVQDKLVNSVPVQNFYSFKEAYQYLLHADTLRYSPDVLRRCNLTDYLVANIKCDEKRTETAYDEVLNNYSMGNGMMKSGQKIISRGEIVSPATYEILQSLRKETEKRNTGTFMQKYLTMLGQLLFVSIFVFVLFLYLYLYRRDYLERKRSLLLMMTLMVIFCVCTSLLVSHNRFNVYILPYALLPIIVHVFLDSRTAFVLHTVTILVCSIVLRFPHEFILLQLVAGLVAIYSLKELSQRSQVFRIAFYIVLTYSAVYFAYGLLSEGNLDKLNLDKLGITLYPYFAINGVFLLFTYPLMFLIEKVFDFTSNVTLVELSNINNKLLHEFSETVPGTFQHSMQVANLAAEAAGSIGGNRQLARTGAMYHDIGKMENPTYFTENQTAGVNPHEKLSYEESAKIIIDHVREGLKIADKYKLPEVIKEFIATHHGKGKTKYFYISWQNAHSGETPDEDAFTYPGPNPYTKEQAVLMMCDAVEAASRSLTDVSEESISQLVDRIVDAQEADGAFRDSPITFKDISTVKSVLKEKLKIMYHTRISYPERKNA